MFLVCAQAHLRVTSASGQEQSEPAGSESGEEAHSRLEALPLDCVIAATLLTLVLQRKPALRLLVYTMSLQNKETEHS